MSTPQPDPADVKVAVDAALAEDLGKGDITTEAVIPADTQLKLVMATRQDIVLAGLPVAIEVFKRLAASAEITLEANPTSYEAGKFADFRAAGVNRVSLGVQSLHNEALAFLGREHSAAEAMAAVESAQGLFGRVTFDLIYARPGQSAEAWEAELARALAFGTEHLSLYQLTIEPGTGFAGAVARGRLTPMDPDEAADLFAQTQDQTRAAGLPAYEISHHARPGAQSHHNLTYWRYRDYVGIGPGAHGRRGGMATIAWVSPARFTASWAAALTRCGGAMRLR